MEGTLIVGVLLGGLIAGSLVAFALLLPWARRYVGRWKMMLAAVLPTLGFVSALGYHGAVGPNLVVAFVSVATAASFALLLIAFVKRLSVGGGKRPILPGLAVLVANGWNTFILVLYSDPSFMGY